MMASFWPTPAAMERLPAVAKGMNQMPKLVCSRTLQKASWNNTTLLKRDLAAEGRKRQQGAARGVVRHPHGAAPPMPVPQFSDADPEAERVQLELLRAAKPGRRAQMA